MPISPWPFNSRKKRSNDNERNATGDGAVGTLAPILLNREGHKPAISPFLSGQLSSSRNINLLKFDHPSLLARPSPKNAQA